MRTLLLISLMLVAWAPVFAQRSEIIAYPSTWRVEEKSRFNPPDWVVLFSLPKNAEIRLVYSVGGPKDVGLFDESGVAIDQNNKVIEVRVGWVATKRDTREPSTIGPAHYEFVMPHPFGRADKLKLEIKLQPKLNIPLPRLTQHASEIGARRIRVWVCQVGMVGKVEKLRPELEPLAFIN